MTLAFDLYHFQNLNVFQSGCLHSLIWSQLKNLQIKFSSFVFPWWHRVEDTCLLHLELTFKNSRRCYLTFPHSCAPHRSRCCSITSRCLITWPWSDYGCLTGLARYATATVSWCQQFLYVLPHAICCDVAALLQLYSVHVEQYYIWQFKKKKKNKTKQTFSFFFFSSLQAQPLVLHYTIKDKRSR